MSEYSPTQQAAISRGQLYNSLPYNAATNPRGMASRGYKVNLTQAVNDVAIMAGGVKEQTDDAKAQADRAANIVASRLIATSTTSHSVSTGSKVFSVIEDLDQAVPIRVGDFIKCFPTSNPNIYIWGVVTARATATPDTLTINVTRVQGSGTFAAWTLTITGPDGAAVGITSVEADTTPKLGGNLDGQNRSIVNTDLSPSIDEVTICLAASLFA
jgi:hypothetical protein